MYGLGDLGARVGQAGLDGLAASTLTAVALLIGGVGGWRLRASREQVLRRQAPKIIYREINEALDDALRATGAGVIPAAEALQGRVRLYLGPLFDFDSAEGKALEKLRKALEGRIRDKPAEPAALVVLAPAGPATAASTAAASSAAAAVAGAAASAAAAGAGGMQVGVITPPPPPPPSATDRDASTREHVIQVRSALEEFAVLWKAARVDQQLGAIQAALLITRPIGRSGAAGAWGGKGG